MALVFWCILCVLSILTTCIDAACDAVFPSNTLSRFTGTDPNPTSHKDPHGLNTCLFSIKKQSSGRDTPLSTNFKLHEFQCKDGDDLVRVHPKLVECVQTVRNDLLNNHNTEGVTISSGYRSIGYNKKVYENKRIKCRKSCNSKGEKEGHDASKIKVCIDKCNAIKTTISRHSAGTASDIYTQGISDSDHKMINIFAKSIICNCRKIFRDFGRDIGLGLDFTNIHVDMRKKSKFATWTYSKNAIHGKTKSQWNSYVVDTWNKDCPSYNAGGGGGDYPPKSEPKSEPKTEPKTVPKSSSKPWWKAGWNRFKGWFSARSNSDNYYYDYYGYQDDEDMERENSTFFALISAEIVIGLLLFVVCGFCCGGLVGYGIGTIINRKSKNISLPLS